MRILLIYWDLTVGGVQHMTTKMANVLSERGHEVTLVVAFRVPGEEPYEISDKVRVVSLNVHRVRHFFFALLRFLKMECFDIIYSATTIPNMVAVMARLLSFRKTPLVISERDNPLEGFKATRSGSERLAWRLKPLIYRGASAVVCVSTPLADALARFTGIKRAKIVVIHNPAAPEGNFLDSCPPHIWLEFKTVPVVIAAGRMHPQKDFPMLVKAFAKALQARDARLILLGDGAERARVEAVIAECGIGDKVYLAGMQKDIMPWLAHADLFVLSSLFEGFGNVLVQALGAGLPIVSTDCPDGPAEILQGGLYGTLTPVGDSDAMALAITKALNLPKNCAVQRARAGDFSASHIVREYEELFEKLTGERT